MLCKSLHHAAFRCANAEETVHFYTTVLELKFSHALSGEIIPSTGAYNPHIHIFLEMEDGSCIAFFEVPKAAGELSGRDAQTPDWIQHFAFRVADMEVLLNAKAQLEAKGLDVLGPVDHEGFVTSLYFFDPSGHRLELTCNTASSEMLAEYEQQAPEVLDAWASKHH